MSRLRDLRKKQKMTAEKMAEILGISVPYLYDLENGRRRLNQDLLNKIRDKFGVSADYILDGEQPPQNVPPFLAPEDMQKLEEYKRKLDETVMQIKEIMEKYSANKD